MKPLHLAIVTETYPPEVNGVAMTIGQLVQGLLAAGHHITLVRPRQRADDLGGNDEITVRGLPIPGYPGLNFGLPATGKLLRHWRQSPPDAVHVVTEGPLGWSALNAAGKLGIPVTSSFHTNFDHYSTHYGMGWLKQSVSRYLRNFHARTLSTMVPTQALAQNLSTQGLPGVCVVGRGVDTQLFTPARRSHRLRDIWGVQDGELALMYVGRLAAEKNLGLLGRTFAAIKQHQPEARLVLVGDGPMRSKLHAMGLDFIFAGQHRGEDLATHYASADLFLFPSVTETFGNVTQEAMASGLAVVAFNYAAAAELITSGENGLSVPMGDEQGFIDAAVQLAQDRERRLTLGRQARQTALNRDWAKVIDDFEQTIAHAIAGD